MLLGMLLIFIKLQKIETMEVWWNKNVL